ncbi:hypothetical protein FNF27_02472 [Cafeteria roenbergensis]|nr:hypothetical protein FNF27_02472 [Cafeteria roenbergensis]
MQKFAAARLAHRHVKLRNNRKVAMMQVENQARIAIRAVPVPQLVLSGCCIVVASCLALAASDERMGLVQPAAANQAPALVLATVIALLGILLLVTSRVDGVDADAVHGEL